MLLNGHGILANPVLWASTIAWAIAQMLKVFTSLYYDKRLDWSKLVGTGGMPSSHSAFVASLAVGVGLREGWDSSVFAVATVFALVVMYDAAGVRRAAGRQAKILNQMMEIFFKERHLPTTKLRELLGHTPIEVFAGSILGAAVAVWMLG